MDAELLRTLRDLGMYRSILDREDSIDFADPESRFEFLRVCRDTEQYDKAAPLLEGAPSTDERALSQELAILEKLGDDARLRGALDTALGLIRSTSALRLSDPFLACAAARAQASFGGLRDAVALMVPFADRMLSATPVFSTYSFLLVRLGWHRAAFKLIEDVGDLDRTPADAEAAEQQMLRMVSAARTLGRVGDVERALEYFAGARRLEAAIAESTGVSSPRVWRWHAYLLRTNTFWEPLEELFEQAAAAPLWKSADNPDPEATVIDSSALRVERAMCAMSRFDGADLRPLADAVDDLDDLARTYGDWADSIQTKGALLYELGDEQGLLEHIGAHPHSVPPRIEYIRLLAERAMPAEASDAVERLLRDHPRNPEALQLRVSLDADRLAPAGPERRRVESAYDLLDAFPEDASALAITGERLAQNGHFADSEALFAHLTHDNPVFGLGWAGRLRAAAWKHDWPLVARIEQEFADRTVPESDRLVADTHIRSSYWFNVAQALARASQMEFDAADEAIAEATSYWRRRIKPEFKSRSNDPLWVWTVEQRRWRHRIDAAANLCREFVQRAPRNPHMLVKYGWVLLDQFDLEGAEERFREALRIRPASSGAWKGMIRALRFQLRFAEAHQYAERAIRAMRPDPDIWCEHAELHLAEHDLEKAIAVLEQTLRLAPNHANAMALYVKCLAKSRDHQRAIAEAQSAYARRPDSIEVLKAYCMALLRRGWDKKALKVMTEARARFANDLHQSDLAVDLLSAGVFAQCGADMDHCREVVEALKRHGRSATAIGTAASLLRHNLHLGEARTLIESFDGWENEFELLCEHAEITAAEGPRPRKDGQRREQPEERPDDRDGYSASDFDLARALSLNPYAVNVIRRQVYLWNARRRFEDSMILLLRAQRKFGDHFVVDLLMAETNVLLGRPEEAVRICERVLDRFEQPRQQSIWLRITHLRSIRATGDLRGALRLAERLLEDYPMSRRARLTVARCLEDFNRTSEALDHLQRCIRELPLFPPVGENAAMFCRLRREYERGHELIEVGALGHYDGPREAVHRRADSGLLAELILILTAEGEDKEAKRCIVTLLDRDDVYSQSLGHISFGWFHIYMGDPASAADEFEEAVATMMCSNEARFGLGQALLRQADQAPHARERIRLLEKARAVAQQNIDDADSERSFILAGQASYQLGRWEEAEECFRKSIQAHPVHGGHLELAVVLNHQRRLTEALAVAEAGAEWAPADARLLAIMGLTKLRLSVEEQHPDQRLRAEGAIEIDRALTMDPTDPTVLSAVVYGTDHAELYLPAVARAFLHEAMETEANRSSPSAMAHLQLMVAELALRYGRASRSRRFQRKIGPKHWAELAFAGSEDPRAAAIIVSARSRGRSARARRRGRGRRRNGDSAVPQEPSGVAAWVRYAAPMGGVLMILLGGAAVFMGAGPQAAAVLSGSGGLLLLAAPIVHRLSHVSFGSLAVEVAPAAEMAGTLNIPTGWPMRAVIMPQTPANRSDAQWRVPETHRQLLGPAVGPMITGHYTYRDANFPWKTR